MAIGILFTMATFNTAGVSVTKHASASQRATITTCRTLFIWIVGLATGDEVYNSGVLFGFLLLVIGTLVYNEIVIVPIDFLRRDTSQYREGREQQSGKENVDKKGSQEGEKLQKEDV